MTSSDWLFIILIAVVFTSLLSLHPENVVILRRGRLQNTDMYTEKDEKDLRLLGKERGNSIRMKLSEH